MGRSVITLVIAAVGAAVIVWAAALLTSPPDRDGAAGLDWLPIALPAAALGLLILSLAWLVSRDRPLGAPPDQSARVVLAIALGVLGLMLIGLGGYFFARMAGSDESGPVLGLTMGVPIAGVGAGLCWIAWRHRRAAGG